MRRPTTVVAVLLLALGACKPHDDPNVVTLRGRIEAPTVDLAPKVPGRVAEILVKEGDRVKAGDLLVRLDLGETALAVQRDARGLESAKARYQDLAVGSRQAELAGAEAEVSDRRAAADLAKKERDRQAELLEKKVVAQRDLDNAQAALERATANLKMSQGRLQLAREGFRKWQTEQARQDVGRAETVLAQSQTVAKESEIRAPADGVILHRIAEPGLLLGIGQSALTMAFANRLYVRTFIPETKLGKVRPGDAASVTVDAFPDKTFAAKVTEISPEAEFTPKPIETQSERVNLVYGAKVDLDAGWNASLVPGQPAGVTVRVTSPPPSPTPK
jgi:HlyD family secretion protein